MDRVTGLFSLWAVLISALAVVYPAPLIPLKWTIVPLLGVVMFGMGVALAIKYFSPAAALHGALFSIWHNLSGAAMASFWSRAGRR